MKPRASNLAVRVAASIALVSGMGGVSALVLGTSPAAYSDPESATALNGVGSDVTQDLWNAFGGASPPPGLSGNTQPTNFYTPLHASNAELDTTIQSWDASPYGEPTTDPGCITTKAGGPSFDRPNSSTEGIDAMLDEATNTKWYNTTAGQSCTGSPGVSILGEIDFARSARNTKGGASTLTFIPYARDALGILFYDHGDDALNTLTTAQLTSLYESTTGTITVPEPNSTTGQIDTVYSCLTISGSVPRSEIESATGATDAQASAAATAAGCNSITQNSGNNWWSLLPSNVTNNTATSSGGYYDAVIPISAGSWESQFNQVAVDRSNTARANGADLAAIDDGASDLGQPYTLSSGDEVPNTTYYQDTNYGYNLYTVIPTADLNTPIDGGSLLIQSLFDGSTSAVCEAIGETQYHLFGFDVLTSSEGTCGSTTSTGNS